MFLCYILVGATLITSVSANLAVSNLNGPRELSPCEQIASATSSLTSVFYPGDLRYDADIAHWASSSTQISQCSVRPGTAEDVAIILQIVGSTRTPFAIKGGGHTTNPGFSSTTGVHISMSQFSQITYDAGSQTALIGAGLIWDDVYATLAPYSVNVVGASAPGVGVAGPTLGGGYSWLSNQYGLTIDTVVMFELVKPNGDIVNVTASSDSELFFGLRGGTNNFGIVTRFKLKTFPQGKVWGGLITHTPLCTPDVTAATAKFSSSVTDPKAGVITMYLSVLGIPAVSQILFYDGPTPPAGIFDDFLAIPYLTKDVATRDFLSIINSAPANITYGQRGVFNTVSLAEHTPTILNAIYNETLFWGPRLALKSGTLMTYDAEPVLSTLFSHGRNSAYPPSRSQSLSPFNFLFSWILPEFDDDFREAARQSAAQIKAVAIAEGQGISDAPMYPNDAIYDTPLEALYGSNVPRLRALKQLVDPTNVMGLAGGFKF